MHEVMGSHVLSVSTGGDFWCGRVRSDMATHLVHVGVAS